MLLQQTIEKLYSLNLKTMAAALTEELSNGRPDLSFEERLGLLVDREWETRQQRRCTARLKAAKLRQPACAEDIDYRTARGLDRKVVQDILSCRWIKAGRNLIITVPSGIGKSWLACAFADHACKQGHTALNHRVSRVAQELTVARADGSFIRYLERIAKVDLLILDDWGLGDLDKQAHVDLLEVLDDRCQKRATLITSQLPVSHWHERVGSPTVADALLDRLVPKSLQLNLKGESLR
jgi:DNA replication protein DnaC